MLGAFAAAVMLSACAGGDSVGNGGASPFGSAGGPGSGNADEERDDTTGGDESTSEVPMTSAPMTGAEAEADSGVDATDDGAPQNPPPNDPGPAGDCCTPGPAGCANDPAVEACVCQIDDYCCTTEWDGDCVFLVGECAPACPGAVPPDQGDQGESSGGGFDETGFGEDGGGFGDCCAPTGVPGCADPFIASCVCFQDSYCCEVEWDDVCAEIAFDCGC